MCVEELSTTTQMKPDQVWELDMRITEHAVDVSSGVLADVQGQGTWW